MPDTPRSRWRRFAGAAVCVVLLLGVVAPAGAHFLLNLNVRIFHIEHQGDGLVLHMRTPMPYLVADKLGEAEDDALPDPAPFTTNAREDRQVVHFVDPAQLAADPLGLGRIAEDAMVIEIAGARLRGTAEAVSLHAVGAEPGFATLDEAQAALATPTLPETGSNRLYVGDAVVDVLVRYSTGGVVPAYAISSQLDPNLPGQDQTANLILDYGPGQPQVFRSRGLLTDPVEITRSPLAAIWTFIYEGMRHILEGLDHVLFVVCLVLGATTLHRLLWRVTGFTIGHSVTLALGFFGYTPKGAWFVPAVETGIALSIIYAAVIAMRQRATEQGPEIWVFLVTITIGLLHGLGFSFVLQEILKVNSPNIWQSLLAFNIGVELGQVVIVLLIWPALKLIDLQSGTAAIRIRWVAALSCAGMAAYWTAVRVTELSGSLI